MYVELSGTRLLQVGVSMHCLTLGKHVFPVSKMGVAKIELKWERVCVELCTPPRGARTNAVLTLEAFQKPGWPGRSLHSRARDLDDGDDCTRQKESRLTVAAHLRHT